MRSLILTTLALGALGSPVVAQSGTLASPVVDVDWLAANQGDPALVVLHVGGRDGYVEGHIPGARYLDLGAISFSRGEREDPDHVMLEVPDLAVVGEALEALGISDDSRVVVTFDDPRRVTSATRVLWTLEFMGLGQRSALLNGGNGAWVRAGLDLTREAPEVAAGELTLGPDTDRRVDKGWVRANLTSPGIALVDGRRRDPYTGDREEFPGRGGHIPGAGHLPIEDLFDDAGMLRPRGELVDLLRRAGVEEGETVVAYCHIGLRATSVVLAARVAGHPALLYDGSMNEWARDPDLPLERGPGSR